MFFTTKNATKLNQYAPYGTLSAHVGAVHCIAVTEDGKLAASGGTDGVHIWDLEQRSVLQRPNGSGHRGATSAILWVRREDEPGEILFFGTQAGYLVCWRQKRSTMGFEEVSAQQLADAAEITGLAFDTSSSRIAVCHRKSTVQSYVIDSSLTPRPLFSVSIRNLVPKAVAFGEFKGSERDVLVFGYHSGEVITLQGGTGEVLKTHKVGSMIGDAGVNQRKGVFCIDDPFQGAALYRLDECRRVKTFGITMTKTFGRPRQVCFADDCTAIVSGSDHGIIYVFDRRTGEVIDRLRVDDQDWAQTVTAAELNGTAIILAARSRDVGGRNDITVWRKSATKKRETGRWVAKVMTLLNAAVVLFAVAFLCKYVAFKVHESGRGM